MAKKVKSKPVKKVVKKKLTSKLPKKTKAKSLTAKPIPKRIYVRDSITPDDLIHTNTPMINRAIGENPLEQNIEKTLNGLMRSGKLQDSDFENMEKSMPPMLQMLGGLKDNPLFGEAFKMASSLIGNGQLAQVLINKLGRENLMLLAKDNDLCDTVKIFIEKYKAKL